jgi:hypothetical protein
MPLMTGILIRPLFLASPMMRGGDVNAVQAALSARGTPLKVDGVFGQATDDAVRSFQRTAGLSRVDGIVGPETWGKLFGTAAVTEPELAANAKAARTSFDLLCTEWSPQQACGILGNVQHESGFDPAARGDGGSAYGLAQWHPDRQKAFQQHFGRPIQGSSLEDQVRFITFELREGTETAAGKALLQATTAESAADIVCRKYERPRDKDGESRKRAQSARAFFAAFTATPSTAPPAPEPPSPATADVLSPRAIQTMMRPHGACPGGVQWALTPYGIEVDGKDLALESAAIARLDGLWNRHATRLPTGARAPAELVLALLDLFADRAGAVTLLPGCDTLAPERTPDLVAVGPLQVTLAAARTALSRPGLGLADLTDTDLALRAGVHALALRSGETLFDPPLVAAAHLAGGLFLDRSAGNRWRLAQGGPVVLIDRFLAAFNAAMQVTGSRAAPAGLTTLHGLLETMSAPTDLAATGPYRAADPESWDGKPLVGGGQCVALVQIAADAPLTKFWKQGDSVQQRPPDKGVAIATFQDGRYINDTHGLSHAALFLELTEDGSGFWVIDQWNNASDHHPPQKRPIPFVHAPGAKNTPANRGGAFSVIL